VSVPTTRRRSATTVALTLTVLALAGCTGPENWLEPAGPAADTAATIWWILFWLGMAVYVVVMVLVVLAFRRGRRQVDTDRVLVDGVAGDDIDARGGVPWKLVVFGGIVGPALVLLVLNVVTAPLSAAMGDRGASAAGVERETGELVVDVVAEKYWWRVNYPGHDVVTANEIHIPAGEPVRLRISSADVIHSFWIPQLAGKIDATPGHTTELVLEADEPGRYRGRCTEYCGLAHAQMIVFVVAEEPDDFDAWLEHQAQPQPQPTEPRIEEGRQIFFGSSCVYCHTVSGHGPPNTIGPDLTHLASRDTIAGGILPNTRGHLGGWIVDPQAQKPGNLMPGTQIAGEELDLLLDYLESLR
jgi:cytochrome c oxidase subunit II